MGAQALVVVCVEAPAGSPQQQPCPAGYQLTTVQQQGSEMPVSELFGEAAVFVFAMLLMWLLGKAVGFVSEGWKP